MNYKTNKTRVKTWTPVSKCAQRGASESYSIWAIKSRRIRRVSHVTCRGEMRNAYKILGGNLKGRGHLGT
jgi:hypothetical protein